MNLLQYNTDGQPTVVCVRHPDFETEFHVFGAVRVISLDLGESFDASSIGAADPSALAEWARGRLNAVSDLDPSDGVRRVVTNVVTDVIDAFNERRPHSQIHLSTPVTEEEYRLAWSTAYWQARDAGLESHSATDMADGTTASLLDRLENR